MSGTCEEGLINLVSFLDNIKFEQWAINSQRPGIALQGTREGEPRYALDLAVHFLYDYKYYLS